MSRLYKARVASLRLPHFEFGDFLIGHIPALGVLLAPAFPAAA